MNYVLHVSHPAALEGTTRYAREIVDRFFTEHTQIDTSYIESYNYKFRNLTVVTIGNCFCRKTKELSSAELQNI